MRSEIAFDNEKYLKEQSKAILNRVQRFDNKLYLEFGGKLLYDYHASRVLPGFDPNVKVRLLQQLRDKVDIILCIHTGDIERKKVRADFGITYDSDAFKLIDDLRERELDVNAVVITRFSGEPGATTFKRKLERQGINVYTHRLIPGYPSDIDLIVSEDGYGANPYIETSRPVVVVTAPGPNSGKMATCLSQIYHDHNRGIKAGYAKFETFPIWNLPLRHPVNVAYEAATADLKDVNMIDPFHLDNCKEKAVNYNRDVEAFPILRRILARISNDTVIYRSPTEMGVNRAGFAIIDDKASAEAAKQEMIRRYFRYATEVALGVAEKESVQRIKMLLEEFDLKPETRSVVLPAREAAERAEEKKDKGNRGIFSGAAIQLQDGRMVIGRNSSLMHASSSLVLNTIKQLTGIPHDTELLSPETIASVTSLKRDILGRSSISLDLEETLIALSISATINNPVRLAMEQLKELAGCEVHLTHIPSPGDEKGLRQLGVNLTCDPYFATRRLFVS
ncbi:MAG: DUF1846 domain-containing protein [Candidatus Thermoplasmatota archaeon]|nr:DUF1846 domain-containing protein [Candidatus Thermoplasmatota archaeon]